MGTSRCLAIAIPLASLACLGAWTATAFGQATPPLPTVSVTLPSVPPVTVPPVTVPPVATPPVTVPVAPVPVPPVAPLPVPAPRAPATSALPVVGPTPGTPAASSSIAPATGSAPGSSAPETSGPAGESNGAATASDADGDVSVEAERLLQQRHAAARRVRETRNVRPVPARFSNRGRTRSSTVLVFWLSRPGRVVFTVLGEAPSCRALGSFAAGGRAGVNRVRYRGRLNGRPLPPGRYTLVPRVYRPGSVTRLERVAIEILPANARTPLWRRTALAPVECHGGLAGVWDSTAAGGARLPARVATTPEPAWSGGVKAAHKTVLSPGRAPDEPSEREDVAVEAPFYTDGGGEPSPWFAGFLVSGLALGFLTMFWLVVSFLRGTWNP
jgi:hypothetical protein